MNTKETHTVGIDLGGTNIEAALVAESGEILERIKQCTTLQDGPEAVRQQIVGMVEELQRGADGQLLAGVGVGVAGQVEASTGLVRRAPNLNWRDEPLQADLQSHVDVPVVVMNDVRAATWGEWLFGNGRGCDNLLCVFVGTGVGGGVVCDGNMLEGCSNTAGEIGHMITNLNGPVCSCGNRGCLEALVGGWAIAHQARESIAADPAAGQMLLLFAQGNAGNVSARTVTQAYRERDPLAGRIVGRVAQALGAGAISLVHGFNPRKLILGGGVVDGLPELVDHVRTQISEHAFTTASESLEVDTAKLGDAAGVVGAAAVALRMNVQRGAAPVVPA